ncbi:Ser/Thr protein phosphatase [Trypanosoma conorhini]|uniref:Serine/threonine-protein phosphatase n=1 Tax=Trypanosoma conorhini TaxID=83891 RepID=A0A3R7PEA2_9TRYP|nr:Ser/Thr protein phosphatase [Trypanosoma conorhini]RNF18730.1 Ser/Thr protein phosphatase [Trypanosoma conorhini]
MGCINSKRAVSRGGTAGPDRPGRGRVNGLGAGPYAGRGAGDQLHWSRCHFCGKRIPEKELNAHTVNCDDREVTCVNSWCREIVKQGLMQQHLDECNKRQQAMCYKCGAVLPATEMPTHRDSCQPQRCSACGELCITRIMKWCPDNFVSRLSITHGPFATEALLARHVTGGKQGGDGAAAARGRVSYNVARMQLLWRWMKAKLYIEETIFRLTFRELDLKKEGFAIFKARDDVSQSSVLVPKRSRSVIQSVTTPAFTVHYIASSPATPISLSDILHLMKDLEKHVLPPQPSAWRVFSQALNLLNTMPNVVRLDPPLGARVSNGMVMQGSKTIVVGDLHGQLGDLLHILNENGMPSEGTYYIFNGDFVDRGPQGVEVLLILFSLLLVCPKYVALNRGNHECDYMNDEYGFDVEVSTKYDRNTFRLIQRCFCALPLATIIGKKVFVVHGGLPRRKGVTLADIGRIQRFRQIPMPENSQPEEDELFQDLLWSDPVEEMQGWRESVRGAGVIFGPDLTHDFLKNNELELIVRSHEECLKGYEEHHDRKLLTVFSASNYDGPESNLASYAVFIGDNPEPTCHPFRVEEDEELYAAVDLFEPFTPTVAKSTSLPTVSQSSLLLRRRTRDDVLRVLRERIYQRRHRLLSYFSKLDRTCKGSVWKIEWTEAMRNVLNLDLPWFFLRGYLVAEDENSRIWYSPFLEKFHSFLQPLWLRDWMESALYRLVGKQRDGHRTQSVSVSFSKGMVNYADFCSVIRVVDYTTSEAQLFQLFIYLDKDGKGLIDGPNFLELLAEKAAHPVSDPLRWDLEAMEQLQSVVIQARSQLPYIFKVSATDRALTPERFFKGIDQLRRGMRKDVTQAQREKIYDFMQERAPPPGVMFEHFLFITSVFDVQALPWNSAVAPEEVRVMLPTLGNHSFVVREGVAVWE